MVVEVAGKERDMGMINEAPIIAKKIISSAKIHPKID